VVLNAVHFQFPYFAAQSNAPLIATKTAADDQKMAAAEICWLPSGA
jgi:hypothetical protein